MCGTGANDTEIGDQNVAFAASAVCCFTPRPGVFRPDADKGAIACVGTGKVAFETLCTHSALLYDMSPCHRRRMKGIGEAKVRRQRATLIGPRPGRAPETVCSSASSREFSGPAETEQCGYVARIAS